MNKSDVAVFTIIVTMVFISPVALLLLATNSKPTPLWRTVTHNGHSFLIFNEYGKNPRWDRFTHDPDCPKCKPQQAPHD